MKMIRNHGGHFPKPTIAPTVGSGQVRHAWSPYIWYQRGTGTIRYPGKGGAAACQNTEELRNRQYRPKSREQWDYQRINEYVTNQSEFRKMDNRPDFDGGWREAPYADVHDNMYHNPPNVKRLHEYFDQWTDPKTGTPKIRAAMAVCEHWDSENFYYPGEAWQRNRPSFRSVPKEMLNRHTIYYWMDWLTEWPNTSVRARPRTWNPIWPPPGYNVPKLVCKREFVFGVEEPGLIHEVERWYWHRMWWENNVRHGMLEWILFGTLFFCLYYCARRNQWWFKMRVQLGNMWYPGRMAIRNFGEPRHPSEGWWWQRPLEDHWTFPEQGMVWYMNETRFGYINFCKKEAERKRLEALGV